jgi:hypothetical protein
MKMRLPVQLSALAAGLLATPHAGAVVKHNDSTVIPGPNVDVLGRWNGNASAVAIDPNYIITVGHPGGGVGSSVVFGGVTYKVDQIVNHPTADLRVAHITTLANTPANLGAYVPVYTTPLVSVTDFTMGGFGKTRGTALTTTGGTYGYNWAGTTNTVETFGRNKIESIGVANDTTFGYVSDVYGADFDGPGAATSVSGEAILAEFDSGGGWFIEDGAGNWKVAALNRAAEHFGFSQFASNTNALVPEPDAMDAVNLSSYATFISGIVPEPASVGLFATLGALSVTRPRRVRAPK